MKSEKIQLKECPFCGGKATLHSIDVLHIVYAICMKCKNRTSEFRYKKEAAEAWNKRVN